MDTNLQIGDEGRIARVRSRSEDGLRLHIEFKGGGAATVDRLSEPFDLSPGDVLLVWPDAQRIEEAPRSLWPAPMNEAPRDGVAVVRLRLDDVTVIDQGGTWRLVPTTTQPEYVQGNTVVVSEGERISRVLAQKPLKLIEIGSSDTIDLARFKVIPDSNTETFDDFVGMDALVTRAKKLIELPLTKSVQLRAIKARPIKGILFAGPPGTGKTMLARIIAGKAGATFYRISGPDFLSKWYGESEAILRRIFEDAAQQERAIIFFDEIDSIGVRRSEGTHEVTQRVVAQLLTLMDGFNPDKNVVVVAATNRPEALDPALRRPGRFDWEVTFTLPELQAREAILRRSAARHATHPDLPHGEFAARTDGWSAADLDGIWSEAALLAVGDDRSIILEEDYREAFRRSSEQQAQKEHRP